MPLTPEELDACVSALERARDMDPSSPAFLRLENAAAWLRKSAKKKRRDARAEQHRERDREQLGKTGLARARFGDGTVLVEDVNAEGARAPSTHRAQRCYMCRAPYHTLHHHYHRLCRDCAALSETHRATRVALDGRRAIVTGGRIKIGQAIALRLLRDGAEVHVTSRFAEDTRRRYASEPDYTDWSARLHVHGLDFRQLPRLLSWIEEQASRPLDILINNAAQTVWRPRSYYEQLWARERALSLGEPVPSVSPDPGTLIESLASSVFGDPLDLRRTNSWVQHLGEIAPEEFVESQVVNGMAPFLLCNGLKPAFLRTPHPARFIINVAAAEGQFERPDKLTRHPHTNMAKAALNMLTCTSAADYAEDGIYMASVDPGWVSHESPVEQQARARARGFHTPLEMEDAAARLYHPIASGLAGTPLYGTLLKDFRAVPW